MEQRKKIKWWKEFIQNIITIKNQVEIREEKNISDPLYKNTNDSLYKVEIKKITINKIRIK